MRRATLVALLALGGGAACDASAEEGMARGDFVATYIDLRRATVAGELDAATRDSILAAHGTSEEELRAYVERHADDPEAIADTWREIVDRTAARDSVAAADTAAVVSDSAAAEPDTSSDS